MVAPKTNNFYDEKYEFTWIGKKDAVKQAYTQTDKILVTCKEESVNWDKTENLYIEGDNLDVLKLLQESYLDKIKMIYIDPPYNTRGKHCYNDNFRYYGIDKNRVPKNTPKEHLDHSGWCNMMYPRLLLARNLLSNDGVIFISIDDNEIDDMIKICDEIFGEKNRLSTHHIQVRYSDKTLNEKNDWQPLMEYVLIYAKYKKSLKVNKPYNEYDVGKFVFSIDELCGGQTAELGGKKVKIFKLGEWKITKHETGTLSLLKETWASGSVLKGNASGKFFDNYLSDRKDVDGLCCLYKVEGIGEDGLGYRYFTGPQKASSTRGKFYSAIPLERLKEINNGGSRKYKTIPNFYNFSADFGNIRHEGGVAFNSGKKPIKMLKEFINYHLNKNAVVLDFFAGSSSTAHAVMQLNAEDGGNRKFIMVQLPEPCDEKSEAFKAGYKNICEIGKERIRRAGKKIIDENPDKAENLDIGFRVFKTKRKL